jgi:hypothetical protein
MFYCLHTFLDPLGIESYMITRPLGAESTIRIVCGKVTQLKTEYYFSHYKEIARMDRKLPRRPSMVDYGLTKVSYSEIYC